MSLPGYDAWKTETPEEERERIFGPLCPFCGAYSPRQCELEEESGGICPWEESEPDPDDLMEQRREDSEMEARYPRDLEDF
jgi:hypothetical protein